MQLGMLVVGGVVGVIVGAVLTFAAMVVYSLLILPSQDDLERPVQGFLSAAALGDADSAYDHFYQGPERLISSHELRASITPESYFGYADVSVDHYFSDGENGFLMGNLSFRTKPPVRFYAVTRRDDRGWGVYQFDFAR